MPHPLITPIMSVTEVSGSETTSDNPCTTDEYLCTLVFDRTGNEDLANAADWIVGKPSALVGLILIGLVVRWLLHRIIDRVVKRAEVGMLPDRISRAIAGGRMGAALNLTEDPGYTRRVQRAATMGSLLKSIVSGVVITVVVLMFISELGYDIAPLIASAGIIGVALGFGSQALVKDFLSGIFMIFEDQYGVGDEVDLGEASGTVEAVSLRVTRLRDVNGTVWYVRNGEILRVGNMSQNWARTVLDIRVAYGEDLARVTRVLADVAHDLWEDEDFTGRIIEEPVGLGSPGARPRRRRRTPGAEDRAAGAVGRRPRDARPDQGPLRPRGHRDAPAPAGRVDARGPGSRRRSSPGEHEQPSADGPAQAE